MTEKHDMYELGYAFVLVTLLEVQVTEIGRNVIALYRFQALVDNGLIGKVIGTRSRTVPEVGQSCALVSHYFSIFP
jgi:hypothetical protein